MMLKLTPVILLTIFGCKAPADPESDTPLILYPSTKVTSQASFAINHAVR